MCKKCNNNTVEKCCNGCCNNLDVERVNNLIERINALLDGLPEQECGECEDVVPVTKVFDSCGNEVGIISNSNGIITVDVCMP